MKKYIIAFLIFFIFIDFILITLYYGFLNDSLIIKLKNFIPLSKKSFLINDPDLIALKKVDFFLKEESSQFSKRIFVYFIAYPDGEPYFNNESKHYNLPIKIKSSKVKANLVLNMEGELINIKIANSGVVNEGQKWIRMDLNGFKTYLSRNKPLIIKVDYNSLIWKIFSMQIECDLICKNLARKYIIYSNNSKMLFDNLNKNIFIKKLLEIGTTNSIIIYD